MVTNRNEIFSIFDELKDSLKSMGVKRIGLFGSFARNESNRESDVDIIVSFLPRRVLARISKQKLKKMQGTMKSQLSYI
jgi:predicted nucleotidyltransferase